MIRVFLLSIIAVAVVGCSSLPTNYSPTIKQISEPPIDSINTAHLGDRLLVQGFITERQALYADSTQKLKFGATIHQGYFAKTGEQDGYEFFTVTNDVGAGKATDGLGVQISSLALRQSDNAICFLNGYNKPVGCATDVKVQKKNWVTTNSNNFQQTLLYNGKVGNKINIAYREFSSDLARPAFNNNVEYDLSESNQIGYKGALLEIIDANNQMIKYKVIRNFNGQ